MNPITIETEPTLEELAFIAEGPEDTSFFIMGMHASWAQWTAQALDGSRFPMQIYELNTPGGHVELDRMDSSCALICLFEYLDSQAEFKSSLQFLTDTLCVTEGPEDKD